MLTQGVWLLHDNAPVHKSMIAREGVHDCRQLEHSHTDPELAASDYFLFRNLKCHLRAVRYHDDEALKEAVKEWLEGQTEDFYLSGINSLTEKCRKCIELGGDYIEK